MVGGVGGRGRGGVDCWAHIGSWGSMVSVGGGGRWRRWRRGGRRVRCWGRRVGGWGRLVAVTSHTVNTALVVAGPEILIESGPISAVESVLLPVLVAEMIDLTSGLRVSVVPVGVATTTVEASVSLVDRHGQCLDSLRLVRFLLQQDGLVVGGRGGRGWGSRAVGTSREGHCRHRGLGWGWGGSHLGHVSHVRHVSHVGHVGLGVVLGVKF